MNKYCYFYSRKFLNIKGVYSPKHETEHIIVLFEYVINNFFDKKIKVIDLGCGTGCIGITILLEFKNIDIDIYMLDIKDIAVKNTNINLKRYNLFANVFMTNAFNYTLNSDILISNPPYLEICEFYTKHYNYNLKNYIHDYINCVGGINWINRIISLSNCKFIILEISCYQKDLLDLTKYKIIKLLKPFINSKIIFVVLMHL